MESQAAAPPGTALSELEFEWLQLPRDQARVSLEDTELDLVMLALLGEAASAPGGQVSVIAGRRGAHVVVLAPCFEQQTSLPIRLGEKVLWEQQVPALRLPPIAQSGVRSDSDARAMLAFLRSSAQGRALVLTDADTESPLYRAALETTATACLLARNEPDTHLFHRFGDSYEAFFDQRGSKYRNQLRKKEKLFVAHFPGQVEFKEYRQADEVSEFLTAAKAINRKTYQFRMFGEAIDDDAESIAAARSVAAAGCFRSFILWHDGQPICFVWGQQRADRVFEHCKTGFDPAHRDGAPGIYSNILLLQRLYAQDRPRLMDFGSGDSDYKRLFSTEARTTANPMLLPCSLRFRFAVFLYEASASVNRHAVRFLERTGAKDGIKRLLRRIGGRA
ncbi:MAG: GNAT family N-acetyltransferase [Telluria sp.]